MPIVSPSGQHATEQQGYSRAACIPSIVPIYWGGDISVINARSTPAIMAVYPPYSSNAPMKRSVKNYPDHRLKGRKWPACKYYPHFRLYMNLGIDSSGKPMRLFMYLFPAGCAAKTLRQAGKTLAFFRPRYAYRLQTAAKFTILGLSIQWDVPPQAAHPRLMTSPPRG